VPWCEDCARYFTPSAMNADGTCPTCGRTLEKTQAEPITAKNINLKKLAAGEDADEETAKAPWHFKVLMVLLALYLTWRIIQLFT
jgi:transcription initiation factor IIE alpha subunit